MILLIFMNGLLCPHADFDCCLELNQFLRRAVKISGQEYIYEHGEDMPEVKNWKWKSFK